MRTYNTGFFKNVFGEFSFSEKFALALVGALILFVMAQSVFAARGINSFTLNGGSSATVFTGDSIDGVLNVTTTGSGEDDDWKSTRWRISNNPSSGGTTACDNGPNTTAATTVSDSFTLNAPNTMGTYNVYITLYSNDNCTNSGGGQSDGPTTFAGVVIVSDPDLVVTKSNTVSGVAVVGASFDWIITITNSGILSANFKNNEKVLTDQLPTSYATYGTPTFNFGGGATGSDMTCSISSGKMLTCTSHNSDNVNIPAGGTLTVTIPVTPTAIGAGTLVNPKNGTTCKVDPNDKIDESDENNNNCNTDSVTVSNPGHIVVDKITNPSGDSQSFGFAAVGGLYADFALTDADAPNDQTLAPGNYSVSEIVLAGWTQSSAVCVSSIGDSETIGAIELDSGETVTCTFTNIKTGHLIVQKTTYPAGDATQFPITASGSGAITGGGAGVVTDAADRNYEVTPGIYGVAEDLSGLLLWQEVSNDCVGIEVGAGATETCTIVNKKAAHITVTKTAVGGDGIFHFSGLGGDNGFDLNTTDQSERRISSFFDVFTELDGSDFSVTETVSSGWDVDQETCTLSGVKPGDELTCDFTNTKRASFRLEKISDPDGGEFQFDLTGSAQDGIPASHTFPSEVWNLNNLLSGLYSLSETILSPLNWTGSQNIACTGVGDNNPSGSVASPFEFMLNPGEAMSCKVNNTQDALISGKKFEDMDADGIVGSDAGISNWTITATRQDDPETEDIDESLDSPITGMTDEDGIYTLQVQPGTYHICETLQDGWHQSYPTVSTVNATSCGDDTQGYELTVAAGGNTSGHDFGNYQNGSVAGYKWEDTDADGAWGDEENALDEWTIFLDTDDDGILDDGEPYQETDEDGFYSFENLAPGTYIVREVLDSGWTQIFPGAVDFKHTVVITSGKSVENLNFGNFRNGTIAGFKWDDTNGDGVWQKICEEEGCVAEPGKGDVIMALGRVDASRKSRQDDNGHEIIPIEIIAMGLTGANGDFSFSNVGPGRYKLFEEKKSGWSATNPAARADSFFDITYDLEAIHIGDPDFDLLRVTGDPDFDLLRDSFFDVFVEVSGQDINQSEVTQDGLATTVPSMPLEFGNHKLLVINQEEVAATEVKETSTVITWTTDFSGTSRVVYDTVSHPVLGSAPNYGYANSTAIFDTSPKVTSHNVSISGLVAGTTYYYRTISAASPESVSSEGSFGTSAPSSGGSGGGSGGSGGGGGGGGVGIVILPGTSGPVSGGSSNESVSGSAVVGSVSQGTEQTADTSALAQGAPVISGGSSLSGGSAVETPSSETPAPGKESFATPELSEITSESSAGEPSNETPDATSFLAAAFTALSFGTNSVVVAFVAAFLLIAAAVYGWYGWMRKSLWRMR